VGTLIDEPILKADEVKSSIFQNIFIVVICRGWKD